MRWQQGWNLFAGPIAWPIRNCRRTSSGYLNSATCKVERCATRVSAYTVLEGTLRTFQDEVFDHITRPGR